MKGLKIYYKSIFGKDLISFEDLEKKILNRINDEEVENIFKPFKIKPWGAQRLWARRFLKGESFCLLGPTGSGKTTAIMAFASIKRSIILVPTSTLAFQIAQKIKENFNNLKIAEFHSLTKKPSFEEIEKSDLIITTSTSLSRNSEIFKKVERDVAFIDDVDGFLKRSKAIDTILEMLKVSKEVIETAKKIVSSKNLKEVEELRKKVRVKDKQLIVSSATQAVKRTLKIKILKEIFGFDLSFQFFAYRNIVDVYTFYEKDPKYQLLKLIKKMGKGGIVYVRGSEKAEEISNFLEKNGINSKPYIKPSKKIFRKFEEGEIDILVGTSSRRSSLVRGIDLPISLRYTIFFEIPRFEIKIERESFSPKKMIVVFLRIIKYLDEEEKQVCSKIIDKLLKISNLRQIDLEIIRSDQKVGGFLEYARKVMEESIKFFKKVSSIKEIKEKAKISENSISIPDIFAYIQASGRTSRLTIGGLTKGLSILMVDDKNIFKSMKESLESLEVEMKNIKDIDIEGIIKEIEKSRKEKVGKDIEVKTRLILVESPTKARTIANFFGNALKRSVEGINSFECIGPKIMIVTLPSKGHFTDLDIKEKGFGAYLEDNNLNVFFKIEKNEVIDALSKISQDVDEILIATDPDAEGEKIAWDLKLFSMPFNNNIKRVRFHEITRREIEKKINQPESFDENLLKAQILRRVEDAWIGLTLSQIVQSKFKLKRLSAGRVQTPVLGWIVERTEKSKKKVELISLKFENGLSISFKADIGTYKNLKKDFAEVLDIKEKVVKINPLPPYTTDSILADAGRFFKLSPEQTMNILQQLFESGLITYHRTDSTRVSPLGISIAKTYLEKYNMKELFVGRDWQKEGAHECIRPTKPLDSKELEESILDKTIKVQVKMTRLHFLLYDLIFRRFVSSQMKSIKAKKVSLEIKVDNLKNELDYYKEILEEGFNRMIRFEVKNIEVKKGKIKITSSKKRTISAFPPYYEAEIIRMMKEKNIGRPSTYAPILMKLKERMYVKYKGKALISTRLGKEVYSFLFNNFKNLLNEERTRIVLEKMDEIEKGNEDLLKTIKEFKDEIEGLVKPKILSDFSSLTIGPGGI